MATPTNLDLVQYAYIAFYGRPADKAGQDYWAAELDANGGDLSGIIDAFSNSPEYVADYGDLTNVELVEALYQQILGREADAEGRDWYVEQLEAGEITKGGVALAILNGPLYNPEAAADDAATLASRKEVADAFTAAVEAAGKDFSSDADKAAAKALLASVEAETEVAEVDIDGTVLSFPDAEDDQPGTGTEGSLERLTVDQDVLTGTENNDTFVAYIVDNQNTLQSGDVINGGAGNDKLVAEIGDSQSFAITAKTKNVEEVYIRTQDANIADSADNDTPDTIDNSVQIDAQDMIGVKQWWSVDSRADLVIEDIRLGGSEITDFDSLLGEGAAENSLPSDVTFGVRSTDSSVSFGAYFASDALIAAPDTAQNSQLRINLMDLGTEEIPHDTDAPLGQLNIEGFNFILNGTQYTLKSDAIYSAKTYAELETAVRAALTEAKATTPALAGLSVTRVENGFETNAYTDGSNQSLVQGDSILLNDANGGTFLGDGFVAREDGVTDFTLYGRQRPEDPSVASNLIETNIVLDNVGRGSLGGDVQIGGMSNSGTGIEKFNVIVDRDSRIGELSSTNNTLKEVEFTSGANEGDLSIATLNNVQDVVAGSFKGNLDITGMITQSVIARDMDNMDTQANPNSDDANFDYTFGAGDDSLDLLVGQHVVAREDFSLNINMGNGDNDVHLEIFNLGGSDQTDQAILANLNITTGSGNDVVWSEGEGNVVISTGAGNDVIYANNQEERTKAVWIANADVSTTSGGFLGDPDGYEVTGRALDRQLLEGASVRVTFSDDHGVTNPDAAALLNGFESALARIPTTNGFATQAQVNQAIKAAINSDPVLSNLIEVVDTDNNALKIESKINGEFQSTDLVIEVIAGSTDNTASNFIGTAALQNLQKALRADSDAADLTATDVQNLLDAGAVNMEGYYNFSGAGATPATPASDAVVTLASGDFANLTNGADVEFVLNGTIYTIASADLTGNTVASLATDITTALTTAGVTGVTVVENTGDLEVTQTAPADGTNNALTVAVNQNNGGSDVASTGTTTTTDGTLAVPDFQFYAGQADTLESDNTINAGGDNDVIVLGTEANSNDTIVFTGSFGHNTIVNFIDTNADAGIDALDFTAYLTAMTSTSGSEFSAVTPAADVTAAVGSLGGLQTELNDAANNIVEFTGLTYNTTDTWAGLTEAKFEALLKGGAGYGQTASNTFEDGYADATDLYSNTNKSIVFVENDANDGEYKVFEVSTSDETVNDVVLVGTVDFGTSLTNFSADIFTA